VRVGGGGESEKGSREGEWKGEGAEVRMGRQGGGGSPAKMSFGGGINK